MSHLMCDYLLNRISMIAPLRIPNVANAELLHNQHNVLGARKYELMPFGPNLFFLDPQPSTTDVGLERTMSHMR